MATTAEIWVGCRVYDDGDEEWIWGVAADGGGVPLAHGERKVLEEMLKLCARQTGWKLKAVRFVRATDG